MKEKLGILKEDILDLLWGATDFDAVIDEALAMIARLFAAGSVYLAEFSPTTAAFRNLHLWSREGTAKQSAPVYRKWFDQTRELVTSQEIVYWCADSAQSPVADMLNQSGARSILLCPILKRNVLCAFLGVADSAGCRDDWAHNRDLRAALGTLSKMIGAFLLESCYTADSERMQQRLETSLQASNQRADTAYELLDGISAGVIIVNLYPDGRAFPQYGNLGLYRMLRIPRTAEGAVVPDQSAAALEGSYFDDFFANIPEPDATRVRREYHDGYARDHFTVKKYRLLRGDGTYVWVNADLTLREDRPGYRTYFATYADVTEEQGLQVGLMDMLAKEKEITDKLEKANQAKSDFLSRMSHDIRTPMNAIMGMTTIASSHVDNPGRVLDCLEKISASSKLLLSIINEVLDMSKVESGHLVLAEEEVDLAELVQGVVTMIQPLVAEKSLRFEARINDVAHEKVVGDMQRLQQVLVNLLSNAVKYTPGGGEVLLEISETPSDTAGYGRYQFVVADTGIGIRPEFLSKIFEPFERAEDERITAVQGTGLGLSICKTVAKMMGGQIEVETEWGKGSRFTTTLYLKMEQEPIGDSALEGLPILVVDDDEIVCRNTCKRLAELGMISEWVLDGRSAVDKVQQAHGQGKDYFAVIIDLEMPGLNGVQTTCLIRERVGSELPVIMISAYDLSEQMDRAQEAGINGFITKPLFRSRLVYKLKQFVRGDAYSSPVIQAQPDRLCAGQRLLLVEDNELNREIATELLSVTGAQVDTAENGKIAVDKIASSPEGHYQLVLMDIQMPVMDGCAAAAAIRALRRGDVKTLPIVAMTANAFADDRERTRSAGMNEHLSKPIDIEQLYQVLQKYLG